MPQQPPDKARLNKLNSMLRSEDRHGTDTAISDSPNPFKLGNSARKELEVRAYKRLLGIAENSELVSDDRDSLPADREGEETATAARDAPEQAGLGDLNKRLKEALAAALAKAAAAEDGGLSLVPALEAYVDAISPPPPIPTEAPEFYVPRGPEKAGAFFRRVYERHIGEIVQADVRRLDPRLMVGLSNEFKGRREELTELLPNRREASDRKLAALRPGARKLTGAARDHALRAISALERK